MGSKRPDETKAPGRVRSSTSSELQLRRSDRQQSRIIRQCLSNLINFVLVFFILYSLYQVIYLALETLVEFSLALWAQLNRRSFTIQIRRFDDDLQVLTMVDPAGEISHVIPGPNPHCPPKDTAKDFQKGLEVFTHRTDCFIRFFNETSENYARQLALLTEVQSQGAPWVQADTPAVMHAAAQTQFGPVLRRTLGAATAQRCHRRRLFWLLPASVGMARFLTNCSCFDTMRARVQVCKETDPHPTRRNTAPPPHRRRPPRRGRKTQTRN